MGIVREMAIIMFMLEERLRRSTAHHVQVESVENVKEETKYLVRNVNRQKVTKEYW